MQIQKGGDMAETKIKDKNLQDYFDKWHMLTHLTDNWDALQRTSMYWLGMIYVHGLIVHFQARPKNILKQCEVRGSGLNVEWIRHPDFTELSGRLNTCSRDQMTPTVCLLGALNWQKALNRIAFTLIIKRLGFFWNTKHIGQTHGRKLPDIITPGFIAALCRAKRTRLYYPLLCCLDVALVVNSLGRILAGILNPKEGSFIQTKILDNVGPDLNHIVLLLHAKKVMPTPLSWLARIIYYKFRRPAGQPRLKGFGPQTALDWYFRDKSAPPLNELYRELLV